MFYVTTFIFETYYLKKHKIFMSELQKKDITPLYGEETLNENTNPGPIVGILTSLKSGVVGFIIFFILLLGAKLLSYSTNGMFTIELNDFIISFWGFLIISFSVFVGINKNN